MSRINGNTANIRQLVASGMLSRSAENHVFVVKRYFKIWNVHDSNTVTFLRNFTVQLPIDVREKDANNENEQVT